MPSQLLVNQEFLADDLDIFVGDVNHSLVDTPNFCLPCATKIILRNAATHPNHASAVQTSIPSDIAGFFHNSSAQNYDRGTSWLSVADASAKPGYSPTIDAFAYCRTSFSAVLRVDIPGRTLPI
ncbi:hypothetical protein CY34DRAFT_14885 [Suillus luteus UH-Slu-Lm8-n1]|uniref:Uncharacterized protein n=1 Tax=Suillus luteus UH-Slu-Lm8-n1 TaxID=930992 RepID=A0A0D0AWC1_9AGAM|nr:hypothetical protein CY34DRAFT_14885 [Suillus luteus UH-Slu-Lm8-n1]